MPLPCGICPETQLLYYLDRLIPASTSYLQTKPLETIPALRHHAPEWSEANWDCLIASDGARRFRFRPRRFQQSRGRRYPLPHFLIIIDSNPIRKPSNRRG